MGDIGDDSHGDSTFDKFKYCTEAERVQFEGAGFREFEDTPTEQQEFLTVSMIALKTELACIEQHAVDGEWEAILWHVDSLQYGTRLMFAAILTHMVPGESGRIMAEMTANKMTRDTGHPYIPVYIEQLGAWSVLPENTSVPDSVDEIIAMGGWTQGDVGDVGGDDDGGN